MDCLCNTTLDKKFGMTVKTDFETYLIFFVEPDYKINQKRLQFRTFVIQGEPLNGIKPN